MSGFKFQQTGSNEQSFEGWWCCKKKRCLIIAEKNWVAGKTGLQCGIEFPKLDVLDIFKQLSLAFLRCQHFIAKQEVAKTKLYKKTISEIHRYSKIELLLRGIS